jgi:DDE superfamily endonuclease
MVSGAPRRNRRARTNLRDSGQLEHSHPSLIKPMWLPTHAPWLNPIEKLWRWMRQDVLKMHRWMKDWPQVKQRVWGLPGAVYAGFAGTPALCRPRGGGQTRHHHQYFMIAELVCQNS